VQLLNINELKQHPRNNEFFDDITGDSWNTFLESIKTSGVIEPIVITQDKTIVSGHQRVRACKELGITEIMTDMHSYSDDDKVLKDLLETNLRQRGIGNPNPVKLGRCIKELERIYGIRNGGDRKSVPQNAEVNATTQSELANQLGMSVDTLNRYKQLADLIPEVEDFLDTGMIKPSTAVAIARQLSKDDQLEFIKSLDITKKYTKAEIQKYLDKYNESLLREQELKSKLDQARYDIARTEDDFNKMKEKAEAAKNEITKLKEEIGSKTESVKSAQKDIEYLTSATNNYLRIYGGHVWAFEEIENISDDIKHDFIKSIKALDSFAQQLIKNIGGNINE